MRFLFSVGLALLGSSLVSGQSCTVKSFSVSNFGSTGCVVADSNSVDIIGTNPVTIPIPTFDTSSHPAGTVLDAVYLNFIVADYQPTVSYQVDGPTTNFVVGVSVPNTWTLFSEVDNRGLTKANLNSAGLVGEASVDLTDSDGSTGCIPGTDSQTPSHSLACLTTGMLVNSFSMFDTTYQSNTLSVTSPQTFKPDYSQPNTYTDFAGPVATATSGFRITTGTPGAGYSSNGAGTWGLTTSAGTAVSTAARVQGTFSGGGSGGHLTINVAHHLLVTVEVQYDFHTPAGGSGDPQFQGFQGQQFQVHGAPDAYFALISAPSYYVNARFDYISTGSCTYNETACFTHPGTYMGMIFVGMKDSNILIQAGPHATGFASILVNDKPMTVGDRFSLVGVSADSYIQVLSKSKLVLALDNIILTIHNSDLFVNFDLALTDQKLLSQGSVKHVVPNGASPSQTQHHLNKWYGSFNPLHGLIGQTWRNVKYQDNKLYQGDITEYQLDKIIDHTFLYCVYEP